MGQSEGHLEQEMICCPICLEPLTDPVTIPCGHSFCMTCIKTNWDVEEDNRRCSCPQCRRTFVPRPCLMKNIMFAALVEKLKRIRLTPPADNCYTGPRGVVSAQLSRQDREEDVLSKHLSVQQLVERNKKQLQKLKGKREKVSALQSQIKALQNEIKELAAEVKRLGKELEKTEGKSRDKRAPQEGNIKLRLYYPKELGIKIKIEKLEERLKGSALDPGTMAWQRGQAPPSSRTPGGHSWNRR